MFAVSSETEWVYRPGFGWVERPVVTVDTDDEAEVERESAAA